MSDAAADEQPRPLVELDIHVMFCPRHLAPFRAEWPKGITAAMLTLFGEAAQMPAVVDAAGADAARLAAAFRRFRPVCCFVSGEALLRVYREAGIEPA